jgi:hypothetical protein
MDLASDLAPHPLRLTFPDGDTEAAYVRWHARHLRFLDPVGAFSCCLFLFCCPLYDGWQRQTLVLAAGWLNLIPIMLSTTPWTSAFFIAHRELLVTMFQLGSLCWHVATGMGTSIMSPRLHTRWSRPLMSCYIWMGVNLFMSQLRWWKAVLLAALMLSLNATPVAAQMCDILDVPADSCARSTLTTTCTIVGGMLLLMRFNEIRMRRLFVAAIAERRA